MFIITLTMLTIIYIIIGFVAIYNFNYPEIGFLLIFGFSINLFVWYIAIKSNVKFYCKRFKQLSLNINKDDIFNIKVKSVVPFISLAISLISILIALLVIKSIPEEVKYGIAFITIILFSILMGLSENENEIMFRQYINYYIPNGHILYNKIQILHGHDMIKLKKNCKRIQQLKDRINIYNKRSIMYRILHKV